MSASFRLERLLGPVLLVAASLLHAPLLAAEPTRTVTIDDADHDGRFTGADFEAALARCKPGCVLQALPVVYHDVAVTVGPGMSEGIVVQGAAIGGTVFRAPVPQRLPVLRVAEAPTRVVLRDFSVDGRKAEQPDTARSGEGSGIAVASYSGLSSPAGLIERVDIANLLYVGIVLRDGVGWEVRNSTIHDIGCSQDLPCPKLWRAASDPHVQGRKTAAFGISVLGTAPGAYVHHNQIWNVSKIGIEAYTHDAAKPARDFVFQANTVRRAVSGIVANGAVNGRIEDNLVEASGGAGIQGSLGSGISCAGAARELLVRRNTLRGNDGSGLRLNCTGGTVTAEANVLEDNCRANLGNYSELHAHSGTTGSVGLVLADNQATAGNGGCAYGLLLGGWRHVLVAGGSYAGGDLGGVYLTGTRDVVLRDLYVAGGGGSGVTLMPDVNRVHLESSVRISHPNGLAVLDHGARNVTIDPPSTLGAPSRPVLVPQP